MLTFKENFNLKPYNTFGIAAAAKLFIQLNQADDLIWLTQQPEFKNNPVLWLGGGSNMLLSKDFNGLVVQLNFTGTQVDFIDEEFALVTAAAGENWHELVKYTLEFGLGGLENLALIPGNVGTAPIQNIGAYGVELKDSFYGARAFDLETQSFKNFNPSDCAFGYRDSYFKNKGKGRFIITDVTFRLKQKKHQLNTEYGAIGKELERLQLEPTIQNIAQAVINIRESKLPNPKEIGNSGSFFKNPVIKAKAFAKLQSKFPEIAHFKLDTGQIKLAAGWLIEQAGWKGYRQGDAGVHAKQALVLVNYGEASGEEIVGLAKQISTSVFNKFDVPLETEVNII
jgi:UDP-N-acetylmuramate dehydrogenase